MAGLLLVLLAFALIIVETHVPSFGIFGVMALVALFAGGNILVDQGELFGIPMSWNIFIGIGIAMIIIMIYVGQIATKGLKSKDTTGTEGMLGAKATIEDWSGKSGRVMVQGELWQATSEKELNLTKGDTVTISGTEELKLMIEPLSE
ncbi:MAG: hypothetical protein KDJ50_03200 [Alphaproteobacteria bacterium]|nr:hypothetical protein [Alphaproteobacteria bacterium]